MGPTAFWWSFQVHWESKRKQFKMFNALYDRWGVNRSGCWAKAYYMVFKGTGPISAVQHVHNARGMLLSNVKYILKDLRHLQVEGIC